MDSNDIIWICDSHNNTIRTLPLYPEKFSVEERKKLCMCWGTPVNAALTDGNPTECSFRWPIDLVLWENKKTNKVEKCFISDTFNNAVRMIDLSTNLVTTIAGETEPGHRDGPGKQAKLDKPSGIEINKSGTMLFIADWGTHTIRTIDISTPDYMVSTLAGVAGKTGGFADGFGLKAMFSSPLSLAWLTEKTQTSSADQDEILYLTDYDNHAIRKINTNTSEVTTFYKDTTPNTSILKGPYGIVVDKDGVLYVLDPFGFGIRRFSKDGSKVDTLFECPDEEGMTDGPLDTANMHKPRNLALDRQGNILFTQRHGIRALTGFGAISFVHSSNSISQNSGSTLNQTTTTNNNIQRKVNLDNNANSSDDVGDRADGGTTTTATTTTTTTTATKIDGIGMKRKREEDEAASESNQPNKKH